MGRNFTQYTKRELNKRLKNKEFEPVTFWSTWYNSGYSSYQQDRLADESRSVEVAKGLDKGCVFSKTSPYGNDVNQPQFSHIYNKKNLKGMYNGEKLRYWDTPWGLEDHSFYDRDSFKKLQQKLKDYKWKRRTFVPIVLEDLVFIANEELTPSFEGMTEEESRPLLDFLYQRRPNPDRMYRH